MAGGRRCLWGRLLKLDETQNSERVGNITLSSQPHFVVTPLLA